MGGGEDEQDEQGTTGKVVRRQVAGMPRHNTNGKHKQRQHLPSHKSQSQAKQKETWGTEARQIMRSTCLLGLAPKLTNLPTLASGLARLMRSWRELRPSGGGEEA